MPTIFDDLTTTGSVQRTIFDDLPAATPEPKTIFDVKEAAPVQAAPEQVAPIDEPPVLIEEPAVLINEKAAPIEKSADLIEKPAVPIKEPAAPIQNPPTDPGYQPSGGMLERAGVGVLKSGTQTAQTAAGGTQMAGDLIVEAGGILGNVKRAGREMRYEFNRLVRPDAVLKEQERPSELRQTPPTGLVEQKITDVGTTVGDLGAVAAKHYQDQADFLAKQYPPGDITKNFGQIVSDPAWWAEQATMAVGNISTTMAAGGGATAAAAVAGSAMEALPTYSQKRAEGMAAPEAVSRSALFGSAVAVLDKIGLDKIFKGKSSTAIKRILLAIPTEAGTEWAENPAQAIADNLAKQGVTPTELGDKVLGSMRDGLNSVIPAMLGAGTVSTTVNAPDLYREMAPAATVERIHRDMIKRYGAENVKTLDANTIQVTPMSGKTMLVRVQDTMLPSNPAALIESVQAKDPEAAADALRISDGNQEMAAALLSAQGWAPTAQTSRNISYTDPATGESIKADVAIDILRGKARIGELDHENLHALATLAGAEYDGVSYQFKGNKVLTEEELAAAIENARNHPLVTAIKETAGRLVSTMRKTGETVLQAARRIESELDEVRQKQTAQNEMTAEESRGSMGQSPVPVIESAAVTEDTATDADKSQHPLVRFSVAKSVVEYMRVKMNDLPDRVYQFADVMDRSNTMMDGYRQWLEARTAGFKTENAETMQEYLDAHPMEKAAYAEEAARVGANVFDGDGKLTISAIERLERLDGNRVMYETVRDDQFLSENYESDEVLKRLVKRIEKGDRSAYDKFTAIAKKFNVNVSASNATEPFWYQYQNGEISDSAVKEIGQARDQMIRKRIMQRIQSEKGSVPENIRSIRQFDQFVSEANEYLGIKQPVFGGFHRSFNQFIIDRMPPEHLEQIRKDFYNAVRHAFESGKAPKVDFLHTNWKPSKKVKGSERIIAGVEKVFDTADLARSPLKSAQKTMAALNSNVACPMFIIGNSACWLNACYLTQMGKAPGGLAYYEYAPYTGELLQLPSYVIDGLNKSGGLRINGLGDFTAQQKAQLTDILRDAASRGLQIKIISKQAGIVSALQEIANTGVSLKNVNVQLSMDHLWIPVDVDLATPGNALTQFLVQNNTTVEQFRDLLQNKPEQAAEFLKMFYSDFHGRDVKVVAGQVMRKYGFSWEQVQKLMQDNPSVPMTPRWVLTTPQEIAETAARHPGMIYTMMHGLVDERIVSEMPGGGMINFGDSRHTVNAQNTEFRGATHGEKQEVRGAYLKVNQWIQSKFKPAEQAKIYQSLKQGTCCQEGDSKDACFSCASDCAMCRKLSDKFTKPIAISDDTARPLGTDQAVDTTVKNSANRIMNEQDARYLDLARDPEKNREELQRMVDEKAAANGYDTTPMYHGTTRDFTVFDLSRNNSNAYGNGVYLTDSKETAQRYATGTEGLRGPVERGSEQKIVAAYLKIKKPFMMDKTVLKPSEVLRIETSAGYKLGPFDSVYTASGNNVWTELVVNSGGDRATEANRILQGAGYDAIVAKGETVVFNPANIKLSDPVTRDSSSKVIPLSERFNEKSNDIRNSATRMHQTAERVRDSERFRDISDEVAASAAAYYEPQSLDAIERDLQAKSLTDLDAIVAPLDSLGSTESPANNLGAAMVERINRMMDAGDEAGATREVLRASKNFGAVAQILRQAAMLKTSTPEGMVAIVDKLLGSKNKILTDAQRAELVELCRLDIEGRRIVRNAERDYIGFPTAESAIKLDDSRDLALARNIRLSNRVSDFMPKDWGDILRMTMQGNALTPVSQVANIVGNIINAPLRGTAQTIAALTDAIIPGERVVGQPLPDLGVKIGSAIRALRRQTGRVLRTGRSLRDLAAAGEVHQGFRPIRAWVNQFTMSNLSANDRAKLLFEGTLGGPAEVTFRLLKLGDIPFYEGAYQASLSEIARLRGLTGADAIAFMRMPPADVAKIAEERALIAVYQQYNDWVRAVSAVANLGAGRNATPAGKVANALFARPLMLFASTPANVVAEAVQFLTPPLSASIMWRKQVQCLLAKNPTVKAKFRREALMAWGRTVTGSMVWAAVFAMARAGLIGGGERDEKKRALKMAAGIKPNNINLSGLIRWMNNGDPAARPGDRTWDCRNMGIIGLAINMAATGQESYQQKMVQDSGVVVPPAELALSGVILATAGAAPSAVLDYSMLKGTASFLAAVSSGNMKSLSNWITQYFETITAIPMPNTLRAATRTTLTYMPETKAEADAANDSARFDALVRTVANNIKTKTYIFNQLARKASGGSYYPAIETMPVKQGLLGRPVLQTPEGSNPFWYNLVDTRKPSLIPADKYADAIMDVYRATMDTGAIPGAIDGLEDPATKRPIPLDERGRERLHFIAGTYQLWLADNIIGTEAWAKTDPKQQLLQLQAIWRAAGDMARATFRDELKNRHMSRMPAGPAVTEDRAQVERWNGSWRARLEQMK